MPVLDDTRTTEIVKLETIKGGEVVIYKEIVFGDFYDLQFGSEGAVNTKNLIELLPRLIKSWNLTVIS